MFIGVGLLLVGVLWLLDTLGVIHDFGWSYIIPIVLIALGIEMIFEKKKHIRID